MAELSSETVVLMLLTTILGLWAFFLSVRIGLKIYNHDRKIHISKSVIILALCVLICLLLSCIVDLIGLLYDDWNFESDTTYYAFLFVYIICWDISFISGYLFIVNLLYITFKGSVYSISKQVRLSHLGIAIVLFVSVSISIYGQEHELYNTHVTATVIIVELIAYTFGLAHLSYLFNKKLLQLVLLHDDPDTQMNDIQMDLLRVSIKVTVLQSTYCFSIFLAAAPTVLSVIYASEWMYVLGVMVYTFSAIVGTFCIYLAFNINDNAYIWCCHCCHSQVSKLFHKAAHSHMLPNKIKLDALNLSKQQIDIKNAPQLNLAARLTPVDSDSMSTTNIDEILDEIVRSQSNVLNDVMEVEDAKVEPFERWTSTAL